MWTSTLDLDPKRVLLTQLLRPVWPGAIFSSFAPLQVQNLPRQPLPEKTWVRVRNRLAGICGSDLHMIQGDGDLRVAPAALPLHRRSYPGHEVVGEVLEIGEDVQNIRVGDRVVLQYGSNCLSAGVQSPCSSCAHGYYNLCEQGKLPGPHPIGGGWSEEMLLPEQQLFRLPSDISDEQAVLLEPTAVAIHAVLRHLPQSNERILIIGAGAIGLLTLQIVRALAPQAKVSVLARHSFQVEQATRLGAAHIIYPQDSYTGIQRATGAKIYKGAFGNQMLLGGYDAIFDTVGSQNSLHNALRWARAQATVVLIGINLHQMQMDLTPVWYQEINLIGSMGSSIETWPPATNERLSTFEVAVKLIQQDQIYPEYLITHHFPLNKYRTALLAAAGKAQSHAIKVVFDYSLLPPSVVPNVRASGTRKRSIPPINDNDSPSENQDIAKDAPSTAKPIEPALPAAASLSSLFSSSHTVAPPPEDAEEFDEEEFDEMEDTIPAPVITRFDMQTPVPERKKVQHSWLEEDVTTLPTVPALPVSPVPATSSPANETISSTLDEEEIPQDSDIVPEVATEMGAIEPVEHVNSSPETDASESVEHADSSSETDVVESFDIPEKSVAQEDNKLSEPEIEEYSEVAAEADTIIPGERTSEPIEPVSASTQETEEATDEPIEPAIASIQEAEKTTDEPIEPAISSTQEAEKTTDEPVEPAIVPIPDAEEPPEITGSDTTQSSYETPETLKALHPSGENVIGSRFGNARDSSNIGPDAMNRRRDRTGSPPQYNEDATEYFKTDEEIAAQLDAFDFPESSTPIAQDVPSDIDSTIEKEFGPDDATSDTENALFYTEKVPIAKAQNRPRPRTRKKNNRTSVEKR